MTLALLVWCGGCWVLRGGAFGALCRRWLGVEPGTTITRIACAGLMAAPLCFAVGWWALAFWASIYAAMTIGYFDDAMGLEQPGRDHAFLALWGATVALVAMLPAALIVSPWSLAWASLGALAMPAYALNKLLGRRFGTDWTERSEFLTGCSIEAAILAGVT